MLITPRTYSASQTPDQGVPIRGAEGSARYYTLSGWRQRPEVTQPAPDMLLIHQVGSVRVGEVVRLVSTRSLDPQLSQLWSHVPIELTSLANRYTVTYTPAADPILPLPTELHVRVKNTSAIPLRAAYLHGPYSLYAACYPSIFDPNSKYGSEETDGSPQFEPYLKAGGNWDATIKMPTHFGDSHNLSVGQEGPNGTPKMTWIIEIQSQVLFSSSAAVHFELLVARDAKSLDYFSSNGTSSTPGIGPPARLYDHWLPGTKGRQIVATKGVHSKAITLLVDDTVSLWNTPSMSPDNGSSQKSDTPEDPTPAEAHQQESAEDYSKPSPPRKRVHLVVITHGLHSNLGADMLYLKESIDATAKKAREQRKSHGEADDHEEEVIVRGFSGNAVRTERGIQYLGKRLAKYVLLMTYPDQPYYPLKGSKSKSFPRPFSSRKENSSNLAESAVSDVAPEENSIEAGHSHQITSISFVGHSLGGLIQTYAIAYIRKHSPHFFDQIRPVNFIALATPFLGLSNENPMYVRFALDFGLVGRTGQDLGLSWTAPRVRSGWGAIIGGRGDAGKEQSNADPGAKPLLRILPCGPAHEALKKFQHRTVYSNVVNDGIVPLRTSCLLFLDWRGLDRVEKARRDNGLVGTMAEWGWAELTGANSKSPQAARSGEELGDGQTTPTQHDAVAVQTSSSPDPSQFFHHDPSSPGSHISEAPEAGENQTPGDALSGPLNSILSLFRPKNAYQPPKPKQQKIYKRSQTLGPMHTNEPSSTLVRGNSLYENDDGLNTPPKTTFFESAGDLLMPPLPPPEFIMDPSARPRTIFHDRIYHPGDVPPPMPGKRRTMTLSSLQNKKGRAPDASTSSTSGGAAASNESGLKVEEKIARAYHRDLTWRKVLVRLEPDAHNNIIVRRMFTNAYGWPVVKHLVDTHFGHAPAVETDDALLQAFERAKSPGVGPTSSGDEVEGQCDRSGGHSPHMPSHPETAKVPPQTQSQYENFPVEEELHDTTSTNGQSQHTDISHQDSARWTDRQVDEDDDSESGLDDENDIDFR